MVTDVTDLWVSFSLAGPSLAAAAGCHAAYAGLRAVIGVREKATGQNCDRSIPKAGRKP